MKAPKVRFIADLVQEHFDELEFLWGQRSRALRSQSYTIRSFRDLEERIEGHAAGVLPAGDNALPMLEAGLVSDNPLRAFASAYLILRGDHAAAKPKLLVAIAEREKTRAAASEALCQGPIAGLEAELTSLASHAAPPIAVIAAEALARHDLACDEARLHELLTDEDALVRQAAWRVVSIVDAGAPSVSGNRIAEDQVTIETGAARRVVLRPNERAVVGRGAEAALQVPEDDHLGRQHFEIAHTQLGATLRDLASRNGTFVNGERTAEITLKDGARIRAGETEFVVHVSRAPIGSSRVSLRPYAEALDGEDREVRRSALAAAALTRQPWLLDFCRKKAFSQPEESEDELRMVATLEAQEARKLIELCDGASLGLLRFELLGTLGHPDGIPILLREIASSDIATAAAAAAAFTRITGANIDSDRTVTLSAESDSDFAREFAPTVRLPSPQRANDHWRRVEREFKRGVRWAGGFDVSGNQPRILPTSVDMQSRWESELRGTSSSSRQLGFSRLEHGNR